MKTINAQSHIQTKHNDDAPKRSGVIEKVARYFQEIVTMNASEYLHIYSCLSMKPTQNKTFIHKFEKNEALKLSEKEFPEGKF
ncbi:CLUMA_CG003143, isoform A [Clunio marinus]|uniref:CLUMA_CG003143, isoform A n=1 Tax=Clunio marinus TaxID=568069 RepID=A0A1J1HMW0_9DIPT|nr:CLUMA_CG003143, isoform A [Clunio marinus]